MLTVKDNYVYTIVKKSCEFVLYDVDGIPKYKVFEG